MGLHEDIGEILFTAEQIAEIVKRMGKQISEDYADKNLVMISVLKGSLIFMADLMRAVTIPCSIDFLSVSSYGSGTTTTGEVRILKDLDTSLEGKDVLVVEDILDSGMTLSYLLSSLKARRPRSIRLCTLLDKPERRRVDIKADYEGVQVPDKFLVGYGLDYAEKYRNLPYIGVLKPEIYAE
ncbi:MAG TPA: hypoxanthine phosphoribosyltransferase [Candidatus Avimonas sp.]|jgi:hypoxanthine phosphoribosyltransferase|nr:hypoxanthine phosphoribosyltransferase [Candidatus Avimonas sp.]HQA16549.1 hypoxanthine phosphoribosyltransferase [Candidatus Avimonas sp.]HQD38582.1 hypoxanthine phosphoribosyltransferase [Candidatus Avimonas sp.]